MLRVGLCLALGVGCIGLTACAAAPPADADDTDGAAASTSSPVGTTTAPSTSTTSPPDEDTGEPPSGSTDDTTAVADPCADVVPVDNPEHGNCSTVTNDCPECHKCVLRWDGVDPWQATYGGTVCVPVAADPAGPFEPCTRGEIPGWDDCDADSMCWNLDPATGIGYCVERCDGEFACDEPSTYCMGSTEAELGCLRTCDPLDPDCPASNEICVPDDEPKGADVWACLPDSGSRAGYGEPCPYGCNPGLDCVFAATVGIDCGDERCCTDLCDLGGGTTCTDPTHTCLPSCFAFTRAEGYEHVSVCGVLPDPLPGGCRPPGTEPNYPWCSDDSDGECPDELFGYGDDCVEECFCTLPCDAVGECATPATGSATVVCEPPSAGEADACLLSCADGETCPDGMHCSDAYPGRCMWAQELVPGCLG